MAWKVLFFTFFALRWGFWLQKGQLRPLGFLSSAEGNKSTRGVWEEKIQTWAGLVIFVSYSKTGREGQERSSRCMLTGIK